MSGVPLLVETSAGRVEYADLGAGHPVLFVHGSPGGWDAGELLSRFVVDAGFRVIAPSRAGYLGTPLTEQNATVDGQAALHLALMDALGIDRFSIVGWSAGGPSSYRLAALAADRVRALVAISAISGGFDLDVSSDGSHILERRYGTWIMTEMQRHPDDAFVGPVLTDRARFDRDQLPALVDAMWDDQGSRDLVLAFTAIIASRYAELRTDLAQLEQLGDLDLPAIAVPVLLVHGTIDADVLPAHSDRAEEQLVDVVRHDIDDGSHISFWTGPGAVEAQALVVEFLRQHATDPPPSDDPRSENE